MRREEHHQFVRIVLKFFICRTQLNLICQSIESIHCFNKDIGSVLKKFIPFHSIVQFLLNGGIEIEVVADGPIVGLKLFEPIQVVYHVFQFGPFVIERKGWVEQEPQGWVFG